ncbi:MAG TPA: OmpA family protein [Acidimicrobiia bacterium]|nr:OmpA family protein [Acidimicrobiia bacterium]
MTQRATLLITVLALAACSSTPVESTPTTAAPVTTTTAPPAGSQVFEVVAMASHPNGAQLRIDRIEAFEHAIVLTGAITNGSPYGIRITGGTTALHADTGETAALRSVLETDSIEPAGERALTLEFDALTAPTSVTLTVNHGGGSSATSPTTTDPSFQLGPIRLDPDAIRPDLPEPAPLRHSTTDQSGSGIELLVEGINYTNNRIGVWVRISNPLDRDARIAPSIALSLIEDDLGNRYPLVLPAGEGWITIPAGTARSGALAFAGRIHPNASSLSLGLNAATQTHQALGRIYPELILTDIPVVGVGQVLPLPQTLLVSESGDHPAAVGVTVGALRFTRSAIEVPITIANSRAEAVGLAAAPTFVEDDLGTRYPLIPLPDDPQLVVEADTTIEATLVFSGRVKDEASSLTLFFNTGRPTEDPETRTPAFSFGPYAIERTGAAPETLTAQIFAVGTHSRLVPDELAVSQVDRITQTLIQFNATPVDGGFRLTLPDSILFDFGSADLRPDSRQALALITEVLDYFENDPVVIVGHTDSVGSATANQRLSEERAKGVVDALIAEHGIEDERIRAEGRGSTEPVAENTAPDGSDNPEGRQLNRRVEIIVLTERPLPTG